jgi:hypothetical protein
MAGDRASSRLWTDNWAPAGPLHMLAPALYAATSRGGRKRLLRDALQDYQWVRDIYGTPTTQVLYDYLRVSRILESVVLNPL